MSLGFSAVSASSAFIVVGKRSPLETSPLVLRKANRTGDPIEHITIRIESVLRRDTERIEEIPVLQLRREHLNPLTRAVGIRVGHDRAQTAASADRNSVVSAWSR